MKVGYARISTDGQSLDMQIMALNNAGCEAVYSDIASSMKVRKELLRCLSELVRGDILIVYKLDRIGRSVREILNIIDDLERRGINIISLSDHLDTTTPQGRLMLNILLSFAQFERELIVQRTRAGLQAAVEKGVKLGRPNYLDKAKVKQARKMRKQSYTIKHICKELNISRATLYRYLS